MFDRCSNWPYSLSNQNHFTSTLKQMRKDNEFCLSVDLPYCTMTKLKGQQHILLSYHWSTLPKLVSPKTKFSHLFITRKIMVFRYDLYFSWFWQPLVCMCIYIYIYIYMCVNLRRPLLPLP